MFTGIIETVGEVETLEPHEQSTRICVHAPAIVEGVGLGDSIAVNGACLTVCVLSGDRFSFDAVRETLECTALGDLGVGSKVNLERAMRADGRFDGHIVQGHVDGVGAIERIERKGDDVELHVQCAPELADCLVDKGSVTVEGVSLTVVRVREKGFYVVLIPHTLRETTLGLLQPGSRVNLEADVLGKYVKRYMSQIAGRTG
jgi:riboflavin synthase